MCLVKADGTIRKRQFLCLSTEAAESVVPLARLGRSIENATSEGDLSMGTRDVSETTTWADD